MPATKATASKPKRPRRSKRQIVEDRARAYFEAAAARDVEAMAKQWNEDGVEVIPGAPPLRGPQGIKDYFGAMFTAFPDAQFAVQSVVADDSRAVVEWRLRGTFTGGPFQGLEPNGRSIDVRGCDVLDFAGGKLKSNLVYFDTMEFGRQLGLMPPLDSGAERAMKGAFNAVTKLRRTISERKSA